MGNSIQVDFPAAKGTSRFLIGQDAQGHWVVYDIKGLVGGIFFNRADALHFAAVESNFAPGAVCRAPETTVLKMEPLFKSTTIDDWPAAVAVA